MSWHFPATKIHANLLGGQCPNVIISFSASLWLVFGGISPPRGPSFPGVYSAKDRGCIEVKKKGFMFYLFWVLQGDKAAAEWSHSPCRPELDSREKKLVIQPPAMSLLKHHGDITSPLPKGLIVSQENGERGFMSSTSILPIWTSEASWIHLLQSVQPLQSPKNQVPSSLIRSLLNPLLVSV